MTLKAQIRTTVALLTAALPLVAAAQAFTAPFSYYADKQNIKSVLSSFARSQGLQPSFASNVTGLVSGRFKAVDPKEFLQAVEEAYGLSYYVLGDTVHFYRAKDVRKEFLTIPTAVSQDLVTSLKRQGFIAEELPVVLSPQGNMLTLRGPEEYLEQLKTAISAYNKVQSQNIVMRVFPIKYAWADDQTFTSMDRSVTVPGIASILRGMVMGQSVSGQTVSQQRGPGSVESVPGLGAEGLSKQSKKSDAKASAVKDSPIVNGSISIMADPRVNAVLVNDLAYRMPYYEQVIRDLDKPVELVEIHAAIVDIDTSASRDLGVNFSGSKKDGNWTSGGSLGAGNNGGYDSAGNPIVQTATNSAGALLSTIYTHGSDFFLARISALESQNAARMLGRPSVLTVDNVQAVLENTTTYYIPLRGTEAVDLYKVESGTVLRVTPHIIREGRRTSIKLAVNVQDDQNNNTSGYTTTGGDNSQLTVSPIKQTKINTQAVVDVGQSLLIGGYYYEQKSEGEDGVPILKDIPLLGHLFKATSKSGRLMERLILLTPRIVTPNGENVPARVDDPGFKQSAVQSDYEHRTVPLERVPSVEKK